MWMRPDPTNRNSKNKNKQKKHRLILEKCETHFIVQQRQYMNKQTDRQTHRPANRRTNGPLIERNGWQGRSEWRQRNFRLAFHIVVSHCCCVNCNVLCLCLYKCVCMCAYFMEGSCRWSFFNEVRYNKFHSKKNKF